MGTRATSSFRVPCYLTREPCDESREDGLTAVQRPRKEDTMVNNDKPRGGRRVRGSLIAVF